MDVIVNVVEDLYLLFLFPSLSGALTLTPLLGLAQTSNKVFF